MEGVGKRFEHSVDVHGCLYGVGRLPLDVGGHGIFLEVLALCACSFARATQQLHHTTLGPLEPWHSSREVSRGEHLTICYLSQEDRYSSVEKRRTKLQQYGFTCNCQDCVSEESCGSCSMVNEMKNLLEMKDLKDDLQTILRIDNLLERTGSKLVWKIRNLQKAKAFDNGEIRRRIMNLQNILGEDYAL